jgi:hypothetical protein
LARVASASMTVGADWYLKDGDPTRVAPFDLLAAGCPFFRKSLATPCSPFPDKQRAAEFIEGVLGNEDA